MVDNSENDSAESIATKPEIMKEMITEGPAYLAAADPLRTKIPAPENRLNLFFYEILFFIFTHQ